MITPFFEINQNEEFVLIDIKISNIRFNSSNIEMIVDHELFIFSLAPYYLRIRLPYELIDDERSHAEFDSKNECIKVKVPKLNKGQEFPDLDLTAKLLARSNEIATEKNGEKAAIKPLIEELDVDNKQQVLNNEVAEIEEEGENFNWEIPQTVAEENDNGIALSATKYGFNDEYEKMIEMSVMNGNDINELGSADSTAANDRIIERLIKENIKFDPEYYAADYIMEKYPSPDDDKMVKELIEWTAPMTKKFLKWQKDPENKNKVMTVEFSQKEQELMLNLPRKTYLIEDSSPLMFSLVSFLFSYSFELRETEGEHNIESAWTIGKLTPQVAFLDNQITIPNDNNTDSMMKSLIITSIRRALCYPLHRNYNLIMKSWDDVYYNLRGGKRAVLKSLLDLREMFRYHDVYYVYSKIWLDDLCTWLISDHVNENMIRGLAHELRKEINGLTKEHITFEKVDDSGVREADSDDEDDEDEQMNDNGDLGDQMVVLNLLEIEMMAEDMYEQQI